MADVKWIKIVTDIFDDEKMLMIETLPSADGIIVVWFKLLALAGKTNNSGVFMFNERVPYTDEMLAAIFRRDVKLIRMALQTFEDFGMIEIVDNVITIPNWSKHQTLDAYERQKERDRLKKQKKRAAQKALIQAKSGDTSGDLSGDKPGDVPALEEEGEEEKEIDKEEDKELSHKREGEKINYQQIVDMYNETCVSLPSVRSLSEARKKALRARFNTYTLEDFKLLFEKAEASSFLKGSNNRNWSATFDWLIQDSNMAKVLDGNYDERAGGGGRKEMVPSWMNKKRQPDYNPTPERVKKNGEWLDGFLAEQEAKEDADLQARVEQLKEQLGQK